RDLAERVFGCVFGAPEAFGVLQLRTDVGNAHGREPAFGFAEGTVDRARGVSDVRQGEGLVKEGGKAAGFDIDLEAFFDVGVERRDVIVRLPPGPRRLLVEACDRKGLYRN